MAQHNLQTMFDIVKKCFAKEYGYTGAGIELSNIYQNTINSYIYNDKVNPVFVHIDELFELTVMGGGYSMDWEPVVDGDFLPTNPVTEEAFAEAGADRETVGQEPFG